MGRQPITGTKQLPPDGTLYARHGGSLGPASWEVCQFYFTDATPETPADELLELVDAISAAFAEELVKPLCSLDVVYEHSRWVMARHDGEKWRMKRDYYVAGTLPSPALPANVSYLIDWVPGDFVQRSQLRSYLPGVPGTSCTDAAHLTTAALAPIRDQPNAYVAAVNAITTAHVSAVLLGGVSFVRDSAYLAFPFFVPILSGHVNRHLVTQRRRLERVT